MANFALSPLRNLHTAFHIGFSFLFLIAFLSAGVFIISMSTKKTLEEAIADDIVWQQVKDLSIPGDKLEKLIGEIERVKAKTRKSPPCEQYTLIAIEEGIYPCFKNGSVYLKAGEIWKIGKTCGGSKERYASGYPDKRLRYQPEFFGSEEQCLIVEKAKIYAYFESAENQKREIPLNLPPGNKIYR